MNKVTFAHRPTLLFLLNNIIAIRSLDSSSWQTFTTFSLSLSCSPLHHFPRTVFDPVLWAVRGCTNHIRGGRCHFHQMFEPVHLYALSFFSLLNIHHILTSGYRKTSLPTLFLDLLISSEQKLTKYKIEHCWMYIYELIKYLIYI